MTSASIAPVSISSMPVGDVFLHIEQRSAEQRWPADWKAEATMSRTACSGSAVESTIIALSPPVSAISGASGAHSRPSRG
jgi:hypothetical protein